MDLVQKLALLVAEVHAGQNQRGEVQVCEDHSRIEDPHFLDCEGGYSEVTV